MADRKEAAARSEPAALQLTNRSLTPTGAERKIKH